MISVVMATYNGEKYLLEQLDSIKDQTVSPDEVIICDDRSTDNTQTIVEDYIAKHNLEGWHFIVNEKNLGYGNNFHQAVGRATGDLIFFSDQDDIWAPDKIEIMRKIMTDHEDCALLCTDYEPYATEEAAPKVPKQISDRMPDDGKLEKIGLSARSIYIGALGCCMCVRRSFYINMAEYWFDGWAQDDRMWRLSQCVGGCYILHSNALVKHRLHGNNTSTYGKYHTVEKRVRLFKEMLEADRQMLSAVKSGDVVSKKETSILLKHIKMMELRIDLLEKRRIFNCVALLSYFRYYEKKKSYVLEMLMAIRNR